MDVELPAKSEIYDRRQMVAILVGILLIGGAIAYAGYGVEEWDVFASWTQPHRHTLAEFLKAVGFAFLPVNILALLFEFFGAPIIRKKVAKEIWEQAPVKELCREMADAAAAQEVERLAEIKKELLRHDTELRSLVSSAQADITNKLSRLEQVVTRIQYIKFLDFISPTRPQSLETHCTNARTTIDILTTNFHNLHSCEDELVAAAKRGVNVRVLCLHPMSSFFKERYTDAGFDSFHKMVLETSNALLSLVRTVSAYGKEVRENPKAGTFAVKIYSGYPSVFLYRFDETVAVGFALKQGRSRKTVHIGLRWERDTDATHDFATHFDLTWASAQEASEPDITRLLNEALDANSKQDIAKPPLAAKS